MSIYNPTSNITYVPTTPYTPTVAGLGTATTVINAATYSQTGDSLHVAITFMGYSGSGTSIVTWTLPSGYTINTAKLPSFASDFDTNLGNAGAFEVTGSTTGTIAFAQVMMETTTTVSVQISSANGPSNPLLGSGILGTSGNPAYVTLNFVAPVN